MSRGFSNYRHLRSIYYEMGNPLPELEISFLDKNPVCRTALRLIRYLGTGLEEFNNSIKNTSQYKGYSTLFPNTSFVTHPIIWAREFDEKLVKKGKLEPSEIAGYDEVYVFINLKMKVTWKERLEQLNPWYYGPQVLSELMADIKTALKNAGKLKGYFIDGSWRRGRKRLLRAEKMDINRALNRFSLFGSHFQHSNTTKLIAEVLAKRTPLEVKFAKTLKDIVKVYSSGPSSCMRVDKAEAQWKDMAVLGHPPVEFYLHHPRVHVAYLDRADGSIRARCICWEDEKKQIWYGRVYDSEGIAQQFAEAMLKLGMKNLGGNGYVPAVPVEFEIPGVYLDRVGQYVFPVPYIDHPKGFMWATWQEDKKSFKIVHHDGMDKKYKQQSNFEFHGTGGFISVSQITRVECTGCGRQVTTSHFHAATNSRYCSSDCYKKAGLVNAMRSDGQSILVLENQAVKDACDPSMNYTNEEAAIRLGAKVVDYLYSRYEQDRYSRIGTDIYIDNNTVVRLPNSLIEKLQREKKILIGSTIKLREKPELIWPFKDKIKVTSHSSLAIDLQIHKKNIKGKWPSYVAPLEQVTLDKMYTKASPRFRFIMANFKPSNFVNDQFVQAS